MHVATEEEAPPPPPTHKQSSFTPTKRLTDMICDSAYKFVWSQKYYGSSN